VPVALLGLRGNEVVEQGGVRPLSRGVRPVCQGPLTALALVPHPTRREGRRYASRRKLEAFRNEVGDGDKLPGRHAVDITVALAEVA